MKTVIAIFFTMGMIRCTVENTTPLTPAGLTTLDTTKAQLLKSGMFVGLDGPTTGTASVYDQHGTKYIVFNPFQSHSGPDLKVYLSKDINANDYIRLGKLQAISGRQVYVVPGSPSISDYNYVHIWCEKYTVDFARAEVK